MTEPKTADLPETREIVKEHDRRVYNLCEFMLYDPEIVDGLVVSIFSDFAKLHRKLEARGVSRTMAELTIELYRIAWARIEPFLAAQDQKVHAGRDTRALKGASEDLLASPPAQVDDVLREKIFDRLLSLDPDYRAPLVLRDILGFEDDEVTRILSLRWGVYRHRLNRGRIDLSQFLRGRLTAADTGEGMAV